MVPHPSFLSMFATFLILFVVVAGAISSTPTKEKTTGTLESKTSSTFPSIPSKQPSRHLTPGKINLAHASIFLPPTDEWIKLSRYEKTTKTNVLTQSELWRTWLLTNKNVNDTYFKASLSPALTVIERSKHLLARNLLHIFPNLMLRGGYVRDVVVNNLPPKDLDFYCHLGTGKSNAFEVSEAITQWSEKNGLIATPPLCLMHGDVCNRANVLVCAPRFKKLKHSSCDPTDLKILVELNTFSAENRLPLFSANGLTLQANVGLASSAVTLSIADAAFDARNKILNQIAYYGLGISFTQQLERRVIKFVRRGWMLSNKPNAKLIKERALDYDHQPNLCTTHPEICVKDWKKSRKKNIKTNKKHLRFRQFFGYPVLLHQSYDQVKTDELSNAATINGLVKERDATNSNNAITENSVKHDEHGHNLHNLDLTTETTEEIKETSVKPEDQAELRALLSKHCHENKSKCFIKVVEAAMPSALTLWQQKQTSTMTNAKVGKKDNNIVPVHDVLKCNSQKCHYIILESCRDYTTFMGKKYQNAFLSPTEAKNVVIQVYAGLKAMHEDGMFHCAVARQNLCVTHESETTKIPKIWLIDLDEDIETSSYQYQRSCSVKKDFQGLVRIAVNLMTGISSHAQMLSESSDNEVYLFDHLDEIDADKIFQVALEYTITNQEKPKSLKERTLSTLQWFSRMRRLSHAGPACNAGEFCASPDCGYCASCPNGRYMEKYHHQYNACKAANCTIGQWSYESKIKKCEVGCPKGRYRDPTPLACGTSCNDEELSEQCKFCVTGKVGFKDGEQDGVCIANCAAGTFPSAAINGCQACPKGWWQNIPEQLKCKACPIGTYSEVVGATAKNGGDCLNCPASTYGSISGAGTLDACLDCDVGKYSARRSSKITDCVGENECRKGTYALLGTQKCVACPAGWWSDVEGITSEKVGGACKICAAGKKPGLWVNTNPLTKENFWTSDAINTDTEQEGNVDNPCPQNCSDTNPARYGAAGNEADVCPYTSVTCPVGTYAHLNENIDCNSCPSGWNKEELAIANNLCNCHSKQCLNCPTGWSNRKIGQSVCTTCPAGWFNSEERQYRCKECLAGRYSTVIAVKASDDCISCSQYVYPTLENSSALNKTRRSRSGSTSCRKNCPRGTEPNSTPHECTDCQSGEEPVQIGSCSQCKSGQYKDETRCFLEYCQQSHLKDSWCGSGFSKRCQHDTPVYKLTIKSAFWMCNAHSCPHLDQNAVCRFHYENVCKNKCKYPKFGNEEKYDPKLCKCILCDQGKYGDKEGLSECENCPKGKFQPARGADNSNKCQDCPAGWNAASEGMSSCTQCQEGTYSDETADGISVSCKVCSAGKYQNDTAGVLCKDCPINTFNGDNLKKDRTKHDNIDDCTSCPESMISEKGSHFCNACPAGTYFNTSKCNSCPNGWFQNETHKRECYRCPIGKKKGPSSDKTIGSTFCLPCTPGEFGEIDDDIHICSECPKNTYSDVPEQKTSCKKCPSGRNSSSGAVSCSFCSAGQYVNDDKCTACSDGKFQPGMEESSCQNCPMGRTSEKGSAVCASCTTGFMQVGNDINSYTCLECESGKIAQGGDMQCTSCDFGLFQSEKGKGKCEPCAPGTWSNTEGSSSSIDCKKCIQGKYSTATGAANSKTCNDCPPGKASGLIGASFQRACQKCGVGKSSLAAASKCSPCLAGKFQKNEGQAFCLDCNLGEYNDIENAIKCKDCGVDSFSNETNMQSCFPCPIGKTTEQLIGRTACTSCPSGTYGADCDSCEIGKFRAGNDLDASICKDCPAGFSQELKRQASCLPCVPGKHQNESGQDECLNCLIGLYSDDIELILCKTCESGKQSLKNGAAACDSCPAGRYGDNCDACAKGQYRERKGNEETADKCDLCPEGYFNEVEGSTLCIGCQPGTFQNQKGKNKCDECDSGKYRDDADDDNNDATRCEYCLLGETSNNGSASCTQCTAGLYGSSVGQCTECPTGWTQDSVGETQCIKCTQGKSFTKVEKACLPCDLGKYGNKAGNCNDCRINTYQDGRGSDDCKGCPNGKIGLAIASTSLGDCKKPNYTTTTDCLPLATGQSRYLDDTNSDKYQHTCVSCPDGALCDYANGVAVTTYGVRTKAGYWRVPIDFFNNDDTKTTEQERKLATSNTITPRLEFFQCIHPEDCPEDPPRTNTNDNSTNGNDTITSTSIIKTQCRTGSKGPLCSECEPNFIRKGGTCTECSAAEVPTNAGIIISLLILVIVVLFWIKRKLRKMNKHYQKAFGDIVLAFKIFISFQQVNGSLPFLLDNYKWPDSYLKFLDRMDFVNIDFSSMIGLDCVVTVNYRYKVSVALAMPLIIVVMMSSLYAWNCYCHLKRKTKFTSQESQKWYNDIFALVDEDQTNNIDISEFLHMYHEVKKQSLSDAEIIKLMNKLGAEKNIITGELVITREAFLFSSLQRQEMKNILPPADVKFYIDKQHIRSTYMSAAVQLLLLVHAPSSQKGFYYFATHKLGDKNLLRSDYSIEYNSEYWLDFLPVVLLLLIGFTLMLPMTLGILLFRKRKHLQAPATKRVLGFLYTRFRKGAEAWDVHESFRRLILTGFLIYFEPNVRAALAVLVCMVATSTLHYYRPHENKIVFCIAQLSFLLTAIKYLITMLSSGNSDGLLKPEMLGIVLITMDLIVTVGTLICIVLLMCVVKVKVNDTQRLILQDSKSYQNLSEQQFSSKLVKIMPTPLSSSNKESTKEISKWGRIGNKESLETVRIHNTAEKTEQEHYDGLSKKMKEIEMKKTQARDKTKRRLDARARASRQKVKVAKSDIPSPPPPPRGC